MHAKQGNNENRKRMVNMESCSKARLQVGLLPQPKQRTRPKVFEAKTNYDVIKNMPAERLAEVIMCPNEIGGDVKCRTDEFQTMDKCHRCCEKWLRQEVEKEQEHAN